jgi:hypothetical protein
MSVYDDPGTGALAELPKRALAEGYTATFDADPAHRYLIGVGCDSPVACWPAISLRLVEGATG